MFAISLLRVDIPRCVRGNSLFTNIGWVVLEDYFFSNTVAEGASRFGLAIWDGITQRVLFYRRFGGSESH